MNELYNCSDIHGYIEDELIRGDRSGVSHTSAHLRGCPACQRYREELADLLPAADTVYTLPEHERSVFSARVRTRISGRIPAAGEERWRRAVVQFAVMAVVVISVTLYLYYSGAGREYIAAGYDAYPTDPAYEYELLYGIIAVPDDELARAAVGVYLDPETYADMLFSGVNGYFPDVIESLSAEEIETILQQLNGV
jgi:hypothetical protein